MNRFGPLAIALVAGVVALLITVQVTSGRALEFVFIFGGAAAVGQWVWSLEGLGFWRNIVLLPVVLAWLFIALLILSFLGEVL